MGAKKPLCYAEKVFSSTAANKRQLYIKHIAKSLLCFP